MRHLFISLCYFSLMSCATIPDRAYHKIVCSTENSCSEKELDANIKPVINMVTFVVINHIKGSKANVVM